MNLNISYINYFTIVDREPTLHKSELISHHNDVLKKTHYSSITNITKLTLLMAPVLILTKGAVSSSRFVRLCFRMVPAVKVSSDQFTCQWLVYMMTQSKQTQTCTGTSMQTPPSVRLTYKNHRLCAKQLENCIHLCLQFELICM